MLKNEIENTPLEWIPSSRAFQRCITFYIFQKLENFH